MGARASLAGPRRESVRFATVMLAFAQAGRFLLGFLASLLIARAFGTSRETEAFFVARILPLIFMDWAGGILKVGFIPTHAHVSARRGEAAARAVAMQFSLYGLVLFAAISIAVTALAPALISALAPGFDTGTRRISISMLRMLGPFTFVTAIFLISETLLNAAHHFSAPARGRVWGRLAVVVAILALSRPLGYLALPISFIIGILVQLVALGPTGLQLWRGARARFRPVLPGTREILSVLAPAVIWMLVDQMKFVVDQNFASRLPGGQLGALNFAFQIVQVIISVTAGAYLTAAFPRLSDLAAAGTGVARAAAAAGERIFLVSAYMAAFVMGAAAPLVSFLLERGEFTAQASADTGAALLFYAPAVLFISVNMLLKTLLFLRRRMGPILVVGVSELILSVVLDALLVRPLGVRGLAMATGIATLSVLLVLPGHLARHGLLDLRHLAGAALRLLPGAVLVFAIARLAAGRVAGAQWVEIGGGLAIAAVVSLAVYCGSALLLGVEEARRLLPRRRRR